MIFASKTLKRRIFEKTKFHQNTWTVVKKSTLRISELLVKYHVRPAWNLYKNLSIFDQISSLKIYLKQSSFLNAVLIPKVFQNVSQNAPKMLGRNWGKRPWDPFGRLKLSLWSESHLPNPSRSAICPHMASNWTYFSPSASCSDILAGVILPVNRSAPLLYGSPLFKPPYSGHNLLRIFIVHDSVVKVTIKDKHTPT